MYILLQVFKAKLNKGVKQIDTSTRGVKYAHFIASKLLRIAFQNNPE